MVKGRSLSYKPVIPTEDNHYQYLVYPHQDSIKLQTCSGVYVRVRKPSLTQRGRISYTVLAFFYFIIVKWF